MRRALAPIIAALVLRATAAAAGEPLELDLAKLGAPNASVWQTYGATPSDAAVAAGDARKRFAQLSSQTALAFSASLLEPASTTGHSGFDFAFESAYVGVDPRPIGQPVSLSGGTFPAAGAWSGRTMTPWELYLPSLHVRKALPFSVELGGRAVYLSQGTTVAGQLEGKWAFTEGVENLPDAAVRVAYTQIFGQRDWNLNATDLDFIVSKRFGVNAVSSVTPYGALRFLFVHASTDAMSYADATHPPSDDVTAAFPSMNATFYRTTLGARLTAYAVSMAGEMTYFGGAKIGSNAGSYPRQSVRSSWGVAGRFGFEF